MDYQNKFASPAMHVHTCPPCTDVEDIFSCWCSSPLLQGQDAQKDLSKFNASAKEKDLRTKINIVCFVLLRVFNFLG